MEPHIPHILFNTYLHILKINLINNIKSVRYKLHFLNRRNNINRIIEIYLYNIIINLNEAKTKVS